MPSGLSKARQEYPLKRIYDGLLQNGEKQFLNHLLKV